MFLSLLHAQEFHPSDWQKESPSVMKASKGLKGFKILSEKEMAAFVAFKADQRLVAGFINSTRIELSLIYILL